MNHILPALNYEKQALQPVISESTLNFHHGKHHQTYVDNLNKLIVGTEFENMTLEEIILKSEGPVFNNAAQIWNHTFYFEALTAPGASKENPCSCIAEQWGSFETFKEEFSKSALGLFGSGWTWLVVNEEGKLQIVNEVNAGNPMKKNLKPVLCFDVWEHAYYLDYQNRRAEYISKIWDILDWTVINGRF